MLYNIINTRAVVKICINEQESNKVEKVDIILYRLFPFQIVLRHQSVSASYCPVPRRPEMCKQSDFALDTIPKNYI